MSRLMERGELWSTCTAGGSMIFTMIVKSWPVLAAILWYVVCQIISTCLRRRWSEAYNTVSTKWSRFFYGLSLFGAIAILLVTLLLLIARLRPWEHGHEKL